MRCPLLQCLALFFAIGMPIVDRSHARDDATTVVKNCFDYMRLDTQHGHVCCDSTSNVMEPPIFSFKPDCIFKSALEAAKAGDGAGAGCRKYKIGFQEPGNGLEDCDNGRC